MDEPDQKGRHTRYGRGGDQPADDDDRRLELPRLGGDELSGRGAKAVADLDGSKNRQETEEEGEGDGGKAVPAPADHRKNRARNVEQHQNDDTADLHHLDFAPAVAVFALPVLGDVDESAAANNLISGNVDDDPRLAGFYRVTLEILEDHRPIAPFR